MTPREKILEQALLIARYAPKKRGRYASSAQVPWPCVEGIRRALKELDIDPNHWDLSLSLEKLKEAL
jgi:hypothetical protein